MKLAAAIAAVCLGFCVTGQALDVSYVTGSSQKLEQFLGDTDFQTGKPTLSQTTTRFHLNNTDLGVSFRHKGQTYVMFGDSNFPGTADALGFTGDTDPESGLTLSFYANSTVFAPIVIPGVSRGPFDVPIHGLSSHGKMYLYFSTDSNPNIPMMGRTVLAVSTNDGSSFSAPLYTLSSNLFINVSVLRVNCADWPGLPQTNGMGLLIFGSGAYRQSDIYLAFQPESGLETLSTIRYLQGLDSAKNPIWSNQESNAVRVTAVAFTNSSSIVEGAGEMSAVFNVYLKKWILFYNLSGQVQFKVADQPWGPYSTHGVSFDPWNDGGYVNYIYLPGINDTNLCQPNVTGHNTNTLGGIYGPYVFNDFTLGSATETSLQTTLYHSMSTWNPYNSILMRAQFARRVPPVIYTGNRQTNTITTVDSGGADAFIQSGTNADLNFGASATFVAKNPGASPGNVARKAYLHFPVNLPASQRVTSAALTLTVGSIPGATNPFTYNVYGLRANADQNWGESTLTWNNAPGNITTSSDDLDPLKTIFLGAFKTSTNRPVGTRTTFSSLLLKDFLNQSSNGPLTLIITRLTSDANNEPFATRENITNPPPTLTLVTVPRLPDQVLGTNSALGPLAFKVDSAATAATSLTVTAHSSNTNVVPDARITLAGTGVARAISVAPTANQAGTTTITLSVSDGIATADSIAFQLIVTSNHPPVLSAIADQTINPGVLLMLTNHASDADGNTLAFNLNSAPAGAAMGGASGVFTWRPRLAQAGTSNLISIRVMDDGSPALTATQTFHLTVNPFSGAFVSSPSLSSNGFSLNLTGPAGPDYMLQFSTNLLDWTSISTNTPANLPFAMMDTNASRIDRRFYRITVGP